MQIALFIHIKEMLIVMMNARLSLSTLVMITIIYPSKISISYDFFRKGSLPNWIVLDSVYSDILKKSKKKKRKRSKETARKRTTAIIYFFLT